MFDAPIIIAAAADDVEKDVHATTEAPSNPADAIVKTFKLKGDLFTAQLVLFALVLFVLRKYAYGPIQKMLDERKQLITESYENSQKIKTELAEAAATRKQLIEEASNQANKIIEEAKAAASQVRESETQKAVAAAEDILTKARLAADADRTKMLDDLKKEVGNLVIQTTSQVVGKTLNETDKKRLIKEASKSVAA